MPRKDRAVRGNYERPLWLDVRENSEGQPFTRIDAILIFSRPFSLDYYTSQRPVLAQGESVTHMISGIGIKNFMRF
jgi:hypothetical protein